MGFYQSKQAVVHKQLIPEHKYFDLIMQRLANGRRAIDIGCREGFMCYLARKWGSFDGIGIDKDKDSIEKAKTYIKEKGHTRFIHGNIMDNLDLLKDRDLIIMSRMLYYLQPEEIGRLFKCLKDMNNVVLVIRGRDNSGKTSPGQQLWKLKNVTKLLNEYGFYNKILKDDWIIGTNIDNKFPVRIMKTIGVQKSTFEELGDLLGTNYRQIKLTDMVEKWEDLHYWMPEGAGSIDSLDFIRKYQEHGRNFDFKKTGYWYKYSSKGWKEPVIKNKISVFIRIYEKIKKEGFRPIEDLPFAIDITPYPKIHRGKNGLPLNYYLCHGTHRTAICRALGLDKIYIRLYKIEL
jgi:hypothetical protein